MQQLFSDKETLVKSSAQNFTCQVSDRWLIIRNLHFINRYSCWASSFRLPVKVNKKSLFTVKGLQACFRLNISHILSRHNMQENLIILMNIVTETSSFVKRTEALQSSYQSFHPQTQSKGSAFCGLLSTGSSLFDSTQRILSNFSYRSFLSATAPCRPQNIRRANSVRTASSSSGIDSQLSAESVGHSVSADSTQHIISHLLPASVYTKMHRMPQQHNK